MDLNVNLVTGRYLQLKLNQPSSHELILEKISDLTKIPPNKQMLVKNGKVIKEINPIVIESPGDIWLISKVRAGVIVHVKLFSGVILSVEVELDEDTIFNVKEKIAEKQDIETSKQALFFKDRSLDDDELKLSAAGIQKGDVLNLMLKTDDSSVRVEEKSSSCCCFL
ncbi:Ubiquitin C [Oopsacas minuta]|uniref:Ubiquitin C n=1 Tax=Oopsacas minuta TaxID=111878 RepID=A0AAV7K649_9METZ|nr:Ubiquitin C [Oopsacas minuta]